MNQTPPPSAITKDLLDRIDLGLRALLGLFGVILALILALATPLGASIDQFQVEMNGGYYSPKLTMMVVMFMTLGPLLGVYLPIAWATKYFLLRGAKPSPDAR